MRIFHLFLNALFQGQKWPYGAKMSLK
jgi:hypothetical protein